MCHTSLSTLIALKEQLICFTAETMETKHGFKNHVPAALLQESLAQHRWHWHLINGFACSTVLSWEVCQVGLFLLRMAGHTLQPWPKPKMGVLLTADHRSRASPSKQSQLPHEVGARAGVLKAVCVLPFNRPGLALILDSLMSSSPLLKIP